MFEPLALFEIDRRHLTRTRHVLVVEDDDDWAEMIIDALATTGVWTCTRARGEAEAEALWRNTRFDLVLLDRSLNDGTTGTPGLDEGGALLARMRAGGVRTPVIMLTSHADGEVHGLDLGADDYVSKLPFREDVLIARINKLMRRFDDDGLIVIGRLEVFVTTDRLLFDRRPLHLSPQQHALFAYLAMRHPMPVTVAELLQIVWRARPDASWHDRVERAASPTMVNSGQVKQAVTQLGRQLAAAGIPPSVLVAHRPTLGRAEAARLRLPPDERAAAVHLTKAWSLDAAALG